MEFTPHRSAQIVAVALISMVVTQIVYFALYSQGLDIDRPIIWTVEAVAFLAIAVFALVPLARGRDLTAAWAVIAVGGVLNAIQVGMGLAMFGPVSEAGEAMAPAFQSILAGAFFLYFAGKFLFGFAAIVIGLGAVRCGNGLGKAIGGLAVLAGGAAMLANTGAMARGMELMLPAGATGTLATLLLALAIIVTGRREEE
ncbi:thiamine biosynthesis protein ThiC [Parerythrobacter lacustris]|uniref:Thiamine biosynthesis protein ThiC n=1 Tax=Parerythrobacter lacustris TaxID=2969984 RepID=A0ABT1XMI2_9SPHN|nr:thiamine biosynthesis protein ThiC [Parerythrobacter lacustris]MCR2832871.1 thiamine biosynthesis protein ThiC [Parerythrobacter lacustris]